MMFCDTLNLKNDSAIIYSVRNSEESMMYKE